MPRLSAESELRVRLEPFESCSLSLRIGLSFMAGEAISRVFCRAISGEE